MSEEEKQAVEKMQYVLDLINKNGQYTADEKDIKHIIAITNLIIKYQNEIKRKDKVFDDCKYTIVEYVKTATDTMQKMEEMIEIEKNVINEFDRLLKGE